MNLRDLEYLVAVADNLHFGKAAKACHVSQPTLSMQVKKLEEYIGVFCFERNGKQVLVTPVGAEIVEKARSALRSAKEIRELAKTAQDPFAGDFRFGVFPTLAPYLLPLIVPHIHKSLPRLKLFLVEEKTDILLERLSAGKLDAAVLALPIESEKLESAPLFEDQFMLAVPIGHALAKRKSATIEDIAHESILLLEEGHCLRAQALEICSAAGTRERQEFRATSLETLRHMVASGVGITLIPKIAVGENDGITYIPFRDKKIARTIGIVWRKKSGREKVIRKLQEIIKSASSSGIDQG